MGLYTWNQCATTGRACPLSGRPSKDGTALQRAARCGSVNVTRILLGVGASVSPREFAGPLLLAAEHGHAEIVCLLLATPGVDPNEIDEVRCTSRQCAVT